MKIPAKYSNVLTIIIAILLSFSTTNLNGYNRYVNHTVGISTEQGRNIAVLFFTIIVLLTYVIPFILTLFIEKSENVKKWPIWEFCTLIMLLALYYLASYIAYNDPYLSENLSNFIFEALPTLTYAIIIIVYCFMVKKILGCFEKKYLGGILVNALGLAILSVIIFLVNYVIVYIE